MKKLAVVLSASAFAVASAPANGQNLIPNGDFSADNSEFNSQYSYSPGVNSDEGQYTVRSDPFPWNSSFVSAGDHTSGDGLMLVANGSETPGQLVWESSAIDILADTDYFFEAFVMNVCCTAGYTGVNSPPILSFSVAFTGGPQSLLQTLTIPATPGVWNGLSTTFNSGSYTNAVFSLVNANTIAGGNDFAVDDIYVGTVSTVSGVPEPATWAMMLIGFGAIGFTMRRRKAAEADLALT